MSAARTKWTDELRNTLRAEVDAGVLEGHSKQRMFTTLSKKYKVSAAHLDRMYRYSPAQLAVWARNGRNRKKGIATPSTKPSMTRASMDTVTMSRDEALHFFNMLRKLNITIA